MTILLEQKIEETKPLLISGNLLIACCVIIATASFWLINSLLGFSFFNAAIRLKRQ